MMRRVSTTFRPNNPQRFESALRRFDAENSRDPNSEIVNGISHPRELLYAQRLTDWACGSVRTPPRNCAWPRAASIFVAGKFRANPIR